MSVVKIPNFLKKRNFKKSEGAKWFLNNILMKKQVLGVVALQFLAFVMCRKIFRDIRRRIKDEVTVYSSVNSSRYQVTRVIGKT
jgi:hypothetical protein